MDQNISLAALTLQQILQHISQQQQHQQQQDQQQHQQQQNQQLLLKVNIFYKYYRARLPKCKFFEIAAILAVYTLQRRVIFDGTRILWAFYR